MTLYPVSTDQRFSIVKSDQRWSVRFNGEEIGSSLTRSGAIVRACCEASRMRGAAIVTAQEAPHA